MRRALTGRMLGGGEFALAQGRAQRPKLGQAAYLHSRPRSAIDTT
jgi:hypothetical protein